jgi:hypothetical protein
MREVYTKFDCCASAVIICPYCNPDGGEQAKLISTGDVDDY